MNDTQIQIAVDKFRHTLENLSRKFSVNNFNSLINNGQFYKHLSDFYGAYSGGATVSLTENEEADLRSRLGEELADTEVVDGCMQFCKHFMQLHKEDMFVSRDSEDTNPTLDPLLTITSALHNYTDCSVAVCSKLSTCNAFIDIFMEFLPAWQHAHLGGSLPSLVSRLLKKCMDFVYNCFFKNDSTIISNFNQYDLISPAKPYLRSDNQKMKFSALLMITFVLDETKADLYLTEKDNIRHLLKLMSRSLQSTSRRADGYHVIELTQCVDRLAKNDVNKELLVELNLLPILETMFARKNKDEISAALNLLFTLSFNDKNKNLIRTTFNNQLLKLHQTDEWRQDETLEGLLFALNLKKETTPKYKKFQASQKNNKLKNSASASKITEKELVNDVGNKHIMISYQHENQAQIKKIKDELVKKYGFKVWIDYEQMVTGSTTDAMASAVENAHTVLVCMSRKYKESNNCRLEAEYAYRNQKNIIPLLMELKYKADGWLGLILGSHLYYDFSGKYPFNTKITDLANALSLSQTKSHSISESNLSKVEHRVQYREHSLPSHATTNEINNSTTDKPDSLKLWTKDDVTAWIAKENLPTQLNKLKLSGKDLYFLKLVKKEAPESFYRIIERYCGLSTLAALASFVTSLEEVK